MEAGRWRYDGWLLDRVSGKLTDVTGVDRVSHYNCHPHVVAAACYQRVGIVGAVKVVDGDAGTRAEWAASMRMTPGPGSLLALSAYRQGNVPGLPR